MEKECECYEEEVQPYRKTDYKPIIYIYIYILGDECVSLSKYALFRQWKIFKNFHSKVFSCLYYIRTRRIIWTFWIQIYSDYHLNFLFTFITVASDCFVMSLCMPYVCIVSLCVIA